MRAQARQGAAAPHEFVALRHVLDDMRLYKSRAEQASLRRAAQSRWRPTAARCALSVPGAWSTRSWPSCCMNFARTTRIFLPSHRRRRRQLLRPCTIATMINGCATATLLLDAGCEHELYASDITRTFPVGGRFTAAQRAVYEVVLEAQLAAIDKVRSGNHWNHPHEAACASSPRAGQAGPAQGRTAALVKDRAYLQFFGHRTGHWLGWTCMMWATTRSAASGGCWNPE